MRVSPSFSSYSEPELSIGVARVSGDGLLQCRDSIRDEAHLEAGKTEVVVNDRVRGIDQRCGPKRRDRVCRLVSLQKLSSQRKQGRNLLRRYGVCRPRHRANPPEWRISSASLKI